VLLFDDTLHFSGKIVAKENVAGLFQWGKYLGQALTFHLRDPGQLDAGCREFAHQVTVVNRMKIVNRYLQLEILQPFLFALGVVVFILLLGQLFKMVNMVVSEGVGLFDVALIMLAMIPQMLTLALPIAFFFAVLAAIGRLAGDGEITAMKAAGISPFQLARPVLRFGVVVMLLTLLMSCCLGPWGMRQMRQVVFDILKGQATLALHPGRLNLAFTGMAIYLGKVNHKTGRVTEVFIEDYRRPDHPQTITASRGRLVSNRNALSLLLELEEGTIHEYNPHRESYRVTDFSRYQVNLDLTVLMGKKLHVGFRNKARSNAELRARIAAKRKAGKSAAGTLATLYERFTQPFACIAFALLGLSLVLVPVRSGAQFQGFVYGLIIILAYHLTGMVAEYLVEAAPALALPLFCLPNLIFTALGAGLLSLRQYELPLPPLPGKNLRTGLKNRWSGLRFPHPFGSE